MPVYTYKAKISPQEFTTGTVEAENERAAVNKLLRSNCHPVFLKIQTGAKSSRSLLSRKVSSRDLAIFFRQLSNLLRAGLPLLKALSNISGQRGSPAMQPVLIDLREQIQRGSSLSESFVGHPRVFSPLEVNIVKSGESSGTLPEVVEKIAEIREKDIAFTHRLRQALSYPVLLLAVGFLTLFVLTSFVLPKFVVLFEDLGQQLPLMTRVLISISLFCERTWPLIIGGGALLGFLLMKFLQTERGRFAFDSLQCSLPVVRTLVARIQTEKFARTLASLLENGVPILTAITIVSDIVSNAVFSRLLKDAFVQVSQGKNLSEALVANELFERSTLDLISVGEQSGQLAEMLARVADMNEREASQQLESLMFILEPALILFLGGIIGMIVMAILLPIFEINFLVQ